MDTGVMGQGRGTGLGFVGGMAARNGEDTYWWWIEIEAPNQCVTICKRPWRSGNALLMLIAHLTPPPSIKIIGVYLHTLILADYWFNIRIPGITYQYCIIRPWSIST